MKRVLTIQDFSCLGKCSLTIALPVISALGVETVILPTAVLSTHTMFKNFTCKDLSDQIEPIASHWKSDTGDLFSSTCVGEIQKGKDWRDALRIAADYTAHTIDVTIKNPEKPWYGVDFEATIPELIGMN